MRAVYIDKENSARTQCIIERFIMRFAFYDIAFNYKASFRFVSLAAVLHFSAF